MGTSTSQGCEAPARWRAYGCTADAERVQGSAGRRPPDLPGKSPDSRTLRAGPRLQSDRRALGSAVSLSFALSDWSSIFPCRGGHFKREELPGRFGVQERAFRLSSSPRGAHIPGFQPFYPSRIHHSAGWPKWFWQINSDFSPAEVVRRQRW